MAQKSLPAITTDPNDPILALWHRWKNPLYYTLLGILGLVLIFQLIGYYRVSSQRSEVAALIEVRDAATAEGAAAKADALSGSDSKAEGFGIVLQRYLQKAQSASPAELRAALQGAQSTAKKLESELGGTQPAKRVQEGVVALGVAGDGATPASTLAAYGSNSDWAKILEEPKLPESAPRVSLRTNLGTLEFVLASDLAPELCDAFRQAVEGGAFEDLMLYRGTSLGQRKGFEFGDARVRHGLSDEALPATSFWGRGPNLAPVPYVPRGLTLWKGWVGALLHPRTGDLSAREIVIATEDPVWSNPAGANQVIAPFARLTPESLEVATKLFEAIEAADSASSDEDLSGEEPAPEATKAERPYFGEPKAAEESGAENPPPSEGQESGGG